MNKPATEEKPTDQNGQQPPAPGADNQDPAAGADAAEVITDEGDQGGDDAEGGDQGQPQKGDLSRNGRFKEVYGKMKQLEREKEELVKDVDAMRNYNRQVAQRLEEIEKSKADRQPVEAPNPTEDPEGYQVWWRKQFAEEKKAFQNELKEERNRILVETMAAAHDDYDDMIKIAARDMDRDPEIRKTIFDTGNAPKAAYEYGKAKWKKMQSESQDEADRTNRIRNARVEGAGDAPPVERNGEDQLTDEETRVVRQMYSDIPFAEGKKRYLAQKRQLETARSKRR